jgi:hypothetical protein
VVEAGLPSKDKRKSGKRVAPGPTVIASGVSEQLRTHRPTQVFAAVLAAALVALVVYVRSVPGFAMAYLTVAALAFSMGWLIAASHRAFGATLAVGALVMLVVVETNLSPEPLAAHTDVLFWGLVPLFALLVGGGFFGVMVYGVAIAPSGGSYSGSSYSSSSSRAGSALRTRSAGARTSGRSTSQTPWRTKSAPTPSIR